MKTPLDESATNFLLQASVLYKDTCPELSRHLLQGPVEANGPSKKTSLSVCPFCYQWLQPDNHRVRVRPKQRPSARVQSVLHRQAQGKNLSQVQKDLLQHFYKSSSVLMATCHTCNRTSRHKGMGREFIMTLSRTHSTPGSSGKHKTPPSGNRSNTTTPKTGGKDKTPTHTPRASISSTTPDPREDFLTSVCDTLRGLQVSLDFHFTTQEVLLRGPKAEHVETFYEKPPPGYIKEHEEKPEDCIPAEPGNEDARQFLAHAPTKGLWMPLGKEVKVMQCWRCKRYGHRTGDRECPFFIKGNQKLEQFRVAHEDPMYDLIRENQRNEKETRIQQLQQLLQDTTSSSSSDSESSSSSDKRRSNGNNKMTSKIQT
ncbi:hypothetical protein WMY93_020010 [Mugilogobius chulae]|uniref:Retinitis pigmentosa 9 protein n=1 Tax=Mugilogobius chulae TaxID=88201 RepID=A0AAW0NQW0_9GOBI